MDESFPLIRDQKLFINVTIRKELSSDRLPVKADRNKMSQVVINLIMNALDVMEKKGILTVRTYRDDENKMACLEISDTGSGIPKENLTRIFDPFFTTKELGKGTGLGLSTAYGIVKDNQRGNFRQRNRTGGNHLSGGASAGPRFPGSRSGFDWIAEAATGTTVGKNRKHPGPFVLALTNEERNDY